MIRFGVLLGDVPGSSSPAEQLDGMLRQVEAAQRNGFSLIAIGQHFLYGDVRWLQPIPTLARISAELDPDVRIATMVVLVPLYHPVVLAEELATLDIVARGRLDVGVGVGYRRSEFEQLGIPYSERIGRFEEALSLIRELWSRPSVDFEGRYWKLVGATPHIFPVQRPTPPVWVGANTPAGVRRSAELGDAWPIGPRNTVAEVRRLLDVYETERRERGLELPRHPIRREIVVGTDVDDARRRFIEMTSERYASYATRGRAAVPGGGEQGDAAILGSPDDVRAQLRELGSSLPVDPVIVRAHWPHMSVDDVVTYLDGLGRHVVEGLRA